MWAARSLIIPNFQNRVNQKFACRWCWKILPKLFKQIVHPPTGQVLSWHWCAHMHLKHLKESWSAIMMERCCACIWLLAWLGLTEALLKDNHVSPRCSVYIGLCWPCPPLSPSWIDDVNDRYICFNYLLYIGLYWPCRRVIYSGIQHVNDRNICCRCLGYRGLWPWPPLSPSWSVCTNNRNIW